MRTRAYMFFCSVDSPLQAGPLPLPPATALHDPSAPCLPLPPTVAKAGNGILRAGEARAGGLGSLSYPSWYRVGTVGTVLVLRDCIPKPPSRRLQPLIRGKRAWPLLCPPLFSLGTWVLPAF